MYSELKPCPFCGSEDVRNVSAGHAGPTNRFHAGDEIFAVNCGNCGASVPNRYKNELVLDAWNSRADAIESQAKELTTANARIAELEKERDAAREEVAGLRADCQGLALTQDPMFGRYRRHIEQKDKELAAQQLVIQQMRKVLASVSHALWEVAADRTNQTVLEAIALQPSTEALDAYVAEKVKEIEARNTDMLLKMGGRIAELMMQRDLAVSVASDAATSLETIAVRSFGEESYLDSKPQMRGYAEERARVAREALSAIKESEG